MLTSPCAATGKCDEHKHNLFQVRTMKKLFIILAIALMLPASVWGLDDRNRTTETIVADALAQLPAQKSAKFNALMGELAAPGAEGIADMG